MEFQVGYLTIFHLFSVKTASHSSRLEVFARIPVNAGVPQGSIIGPSPFLLIINDLPVDIICIIAVYADDSTLYSKYKQVSDLWQQLDVALELKSDLQDTTDWSRKWLVDINTGKT